MKMLWSRPAGEAATEVRLGHGIAAVIAAAAGDRMTFALVDPAVRTWAGLPPSWPRRVGLPGEQQKTLIACESVLRDMVTAGLDRSSLMVAIGGGATGDAGGLCASLYQRGIEFWQVPTTLLAMVDSSVGGKTAVNLPEGKNLIGTVHPARLVVIDIDFLDSLPEQQFLSGLAEAIKMGVGLDAELFALLERERERVLRRDPAVMLDVIERSIAAKIAVVEGDLHEDGRRRLLNLGHTLGHAVEAHADGRLPHGHCVARGLHFALDLAAARGAIAGAEHARCTALLASFGFLPDALPPTAELMAFVAHDKKVRDGVVQFALPIGVGDSRVEPIELAAIERQLS